MYNCMYNINHNQFYILSLEVLAQVYFKPVRNPPAFISRSLIRIYFPDIPARMDKDSFYLEGYLDSLDSLPEDVKKTFTKMLELDNRNTDITKEIDAISEDYLRKVEEKRLPSRRRKQEMEKISKMFEEAKVNSDTKVKLAIDTYELVDKHIRKLDADLVKFETEMKEAGGRLSQTESEDEEVVQKKEKKKKKKAEREEEARRKASEVVAPVVPCPEVPIVDMPVDPNEPTYCLCQQVSYGEMIGCDNQDCPIEWFHFGCMGLQTKPKGRWYCPKCTTMFKKPK